MIYCKVSDLRNYISYSKNMEKAINFLFSNDLKKLPMGKTVIDGEKIYINKSEVDTKSAEEQKYEVHRKYIDIQLDINGDELIYFKNNDSECVQDYREDEDYALYKFCKPEASLTLNEKFCVVIFSNEKHMPCIKNKSKTVKKCVIKVLEE